MTPGSEHPQLTGEVMGSMAIQKAYALDRPRTPMPMPPAIAASPDALALLKALQRRWALALSVGILAAGISAAVAWFAVPPSSYTARALLYVASQQPNIIFRTAETNVDFRTYQSTQLTLLRSHLVLNTALRILQEQKQQNPKVDDLTILNDKTDPIAWLEEELQAGYTGEILSISMEGDNPNDLARVVNAVTDAYMSEIVNADDTERQKRYDGLKEIYDNYQKKLKEKREVLNKLAEKLGATDKETVRITHELALEKRAATERELLQIRRDLRKAETELAVRKQAVPETMPAVPDSLVDAEIAKNPTVIQWKQQIEELKATAARNSRLASASKKMSEPSIQRPMKDVKEIQKKMADYIARYRPWYVEQVQKRARSSQTSELVLLQQQIDVLKGLEKVTEAEVKALNVETQGINRNSLELETLKDEIAHATAASDKVGDEVEALNVELHAPPRVRIAEEAGTPRLEADKRPKMAGVAGLGAFGLVLIGVSVFEYRARRIASVDEVVHGLGMRLVGSLPPLPSASRRQLGAARQTQEASWNALLVESVDSARTMLLHASATEGLQVVMITSAVGGEGKTSLACHMSASLARAGRKTLLVDADLRSPSAHRLFDLPLEPGLSEILRSEAAIEDVIQPTAAPGLSMITAGRSNPQAIQALARPDLRQIFDWLKHHFDFVVIDTSPVLPVADTLLLGQHVDAAICSILRGVSRVPNVYATNERLLSLGIRNLGAVMAGVRSDVYGSESYPYQPQISN